jgi:hypothetical protein
MLIGKTVNTFQRWDREKLLNTHHFPTGRRYSTHNH